MAPVSSTQQTQAAQTQQPLDAKQKLRLQHAVKEFEAVLVGYMLKSMRSSIPKDEMFGESYGGDMLEGMFDVELARHVSRGSNLGLGEMLYKEITGEEMPRTMTPTSHPVTRAGSVSAAVPASARAGVAAKPAARSDGAGTPGSAPVPARHETLPKSAVSGMGTISTTSAAPPDTVRRRMEALSPIIRDAAEMHGVDASLLKAVIATESAGRTTAQSSKQAKGLMQLIDSTAAAMGVRNVWDPQQNVNGGAKYLSQLLNRFRGNVEHALASYNAGPGAVEKHKGIPPYKETQAYVGKVLQYLRHFEQQESGTNDEN